MRFIFVVVFGLLLASGLSFSVNIGSCTNLSTAGTTYVLTSDLSGAPTPMGIGPNSACLRIDASNIVLDCAGHKIDYGAAPPSTPPSRFGILVNQNSSITLSGITVKNCIVQNYTTDIQGFNLTGSSFLNNTVNGLYPNFDFRCDSGCSSVLVQNNSMVQGYGGILLHDVGDNNLVNNNKVIDNTVFGIWIETTNTNVTNNVVTGGNNFFSFEADGTATNARFENNNASLVGLGFYISAPNAIIRNNKVWDSLGALGGVGFDIFGDNDLVTLNYAWNNTQGFSVSGTGTNVTNNTAFLNLGDGFFVGGVLANQNDAHGNTGNGFSIGDGTTVISNSAYSNGGHGFSISGASDNSLSGNTAHDNNGTGFFAESTPGGCTEGCFPPSPINDNNFTSDSAFNNGGDGFAISDPNGANSTGNNIVNSNGTLNGGNGASIDGMTLTNIDPSIFCNNAGAGVLINNSSGLTISDTLACNNTAGFDVYNSDTILFTRDNATGNNPDGFRTESSTGINFTSNNGKGNAENGWRQNFASDGFLFTNNNATGNGVNGFLAQVSANDNVYDTNNASGNGQNGFFLEFSADNATIVNNIANGNSLHGFALQTSSNDNLTNNVANGNGNSGFFLIFGSENDVLDSNNASGNTYGFRIVTSNGTSLTNSLSSGNSQDGLLIDTSSGTVVNGIHFINNAPDFGVTGGPLVLNATNAVFDGPLGGFQNYTNLSFDDSLGSGESYSIDWSTLPSPFPAGTSSFNQKFVNIVALSGSPSIEHATWSWLPSEVGPVVESGLQLWEFHSGWLARNVTPDTANHRLSLSDIANFSTFAVVLNNNVSAVKVDVTPLLPSPGGMTQWQINVTNTGTGPLDPVAVTDILPPGLQFVSATPAPDSVSPDNLTADWANVGPLAVGASAIITLNASVDANASNGTYFNSVNVTASPANGTGSDITASDSTPIGIFAPGVGIVKTLVTAIPLTGSNTTYMLNITNTGSINLTLTVVDSLDLNYTFKGSNVAPTSVSNGSIIWTNFTVLPVGASTVILYNISFTGPGFYTNNVTVTGAPPNGNSVSDNSTLKVAVFSPVPPGGNEPHLQTLSVSMVSNCTGNVITVTSGGPVQGAEVFVDGNSIGLTDQNGQLSFQGCGSSVTIRASKSGYEDGTASVSEVACGQCAGPVCTTNADCQPDKACQVNANASLNACVPVQCSCGVIQSHECVNYQCCSNADCGAGNVCLDHQCKPQPGCTSDLQCKDSEVCRTASGAPGTSSAPGSCTNVTGQCGYAANHAFVPYNYTCGTEPGCPSCPNGQSCVAHQCISNDISCPSSGVVGENKTCQLTQDNKACTPDQNCTATVTTPDGKVFNVVPDEDGNVRLPLTVQGRYTITLLKDGQVVKQVFVNAVPRSAPGGENPPSATGGDLGSLLWLLLLLLIVVGAVIYWRSRGQKK